MAFVLADRNPRRHFAPFVRSAATRAKMSAASKAAWADPAARARMSAATKAALADPAVRARMSAARKAVLADPAVRAKMSAARKRDWARRCVRAAGLVPWRATVDRAAALLAAGDPVEVVVDALRQEARAA
ncbi:MAG TPA: hypothetical protein VGS12_13445 [Caulobacteraceae bacterium]|nr:hypothetical protein [Caulobacteraceae bacterium]